MPKFESHITFHINNAPDVERLGGQMGWKFSKIDGDPLMGAKPFCYLTAYDPDGPTLYANMINVHHYADTLSIPVLRTKVEQIVFDSKTGLDEFNYAR